MAVSRDTGARIAVVFYAAVYAGALTYVWHPTHRPMEGRASFSTERFTDFTQNIAAAEFLLGGQNPYAQIGPGRPFDWQFPYYYPLSTALIAMPFTLLPLDLAEAFFVASSVGLLVWAMTRHTVKNPQLCFLGSLAFMAVAGRAQMSPALMAGALLPWFGCILAVKPSIGAALLCAYPSWRSIGGAVAITAVTIAVWPYWVRDWLAVLPDIEHMVALITLPGGFLVCLALLKWRRPEARLLVALACVPHTPSLYDVLPLFLCVRTWREGIGLAGLTYVAYAFIGGGPFDAYQDIQNFNELCYVRAQRNLWLLYMPCVLAVVARPNVASAGDGLAAFLQSLKSMRGRWATPSGEPAARL